MVKDKEVVEGAIVEEEIKNEEETPKEGYNTGIIVRSKIKGVVRKLDEEGKMPNVSEDIGPELDRIVEEVLKKGIERARKNQRRTLFARDL